MKRELIIVREPPVTLFGLAFTAILICMFWKWILLTIGLIAAAVLGCYLIGAIRKDLREQARLDAETTARAERQHAQYMEGDLHGTYGEDYDDGEAVG